MPGPDRTLVAAGAGDGDAGLFRRRGSAGLAWVTVRASAWPVEAWPSETCWRRLSSRCPAGAGASAAAPPGVAVGLAWQAWR